MKTCPQCGDGSIEIGEQLVAKPIGTFSLAGAQLKTTAMTFMAATCTNDACDWKVYGHLENATFDNHGRFTGGHFVVSAMVAPPSQPDE